VLRRAPIISNPVCLLCSWSMIKYVNFSKIAQLHAVAHYTTLLIDLTLGEHLQILGERQGGMSKSGICNTKRDISKTKQPEPKLLQNVYRNSSTTYRLMTFPVSKIFAQGISRILFVGARQNLAVLGVRPMDTYSYSPNLVNFGLLFRGGDFDSGYLAYCLSERDEIWRRWRSGQSKLIPRILGECQELWFWGPVIPCGDTHQSFTDTLVKWFLTTFLCLSIVLYLFLFTALPED